MLADLNHGIRLPEPLVHYRVHAESMTDRHTPGVFAEYLANVCTEVAARLDQLCDQPPTWAAADQLAGLAVQYRGRSAELHHEAHRQREQTALDPPGKATQYDRRRTVL